MVLGTILLGTQIKILLKNLPLDTKEENLLKIYMEVFLQHKVNLTRQNIRHLQQNIIHLCHAVNLILYARSSLPLLFPRLKSGVTKPSVMVIEI